MNTKPLTTFQMKNIRKALQHALAEIHNPGAANASGFELLNSIDNAIRCLTHSIEHEVEA